MFAQPSNKIDVFEATRSGKIVLVSTAKDLLKSDGSALLGRFFIRMLAQAALERSVLGEWERTPTFVYVDEAQEYFDDGVEAILQQARKYRIALVAAHQSLDQASPRLRSALFANTSFKCAGGVSAKDARALADELHTSADFIGSMTRRGGRTEFAAWIKNWTAGAVRLSVPLGFLERQPTLSEEQLDEVIARNRIRYCGTLEEVRQALAPRVPALPTPSTEEAGRPVSQGARTNCRTVRALPRFTIRRTRVGEGWEEASVPPEPGQRSGGAAGIPRDHRSAHGGRTGRCSA
jgi:hypothetical protein